MKKKSIILLMVIAFTGLIFAEGAQEAPQGYQAPEPATLTGTLDLSGFPPVLQADGKKYLIMVPPYATSGVELKDGQKITLEGYVHPAYGRFAATDTNVIAVTKAVIDGKEYEIPAPGPGMGRFAQGPAPYGYGPGCPWYDNDDYGRGSRGPGRMMQGSPMWGGGPGYYGNQRGPRGRW